MTDITDQDRRAARKWAEDIAGSRQVNIRAEADAAARIILATVKAPAPTLAEELRALGELLEEEGGAGAKSTVWARDLANRAEQIEQERDEARAEVEHLTAVDGLEWQWGRRGGGGVDWARSEGSARNHFEMAQGYLVRRLIGPVETVEGP